MTRAQHCPALLVAAPASGQGKTTVTAALARLWVRRGHRVCVFKCGPDFIDPHWHELASGQSVHNLDLWLNGAADVRRRLRDAARDHDLILIEGVMGLFDGSPSAAELAIMLGIPVLAVIDASAMAGTFGALAYGLRHYQPGLPWAGVLANRVAGAAHEHMLRQAVPAASPEDDAHAAVAAGWLGALHADANIAWPERHLGLTLAAELPDALTRLDAAADALARTPLGQLDIAGWQRWQVEFSAGEPPAIDPRLTGRTIAVARDRAFCFIYQANLDVLRQLGAQLCFFSPLADEPLPDCDAVWLPGGYPELHAASLAGADVTRASLAAHVSAGRPVWAECGGMMVLFDTLTLNDGERHAMWGLLQGEVCMQPRLAALGPQQWPTRDGELRGHTFHFSSVHTAQVPLAHTESPQGGQRGEAVFAAGALRASYFHAWFASNPAASAALFLPESL